MREKINLLFFVIILQVIRPSNLEAALLFKSNSTKKTQKTFEEVPKDQKNLLLKKQQDLGQSITKSLEKTDEATIRSSLKKYELILSREKKKENIISLEFNRIICIMQLARLTRIKSGGKKLVSEEEVYLKNALRGIELILNQKTISKDLRGQLLFYQGMNYLDLGLSEKSRTSFEAAVETSPSSKYVSSLSIYLADIYYDDGDLNKALRAYKRFYAQMTKDEKDLASYKVAWILLNQSKIDQSIQVFLSLIKNSESKSIVQDAVMSISVALSENYDEDKVIYILSKSQLKNDLRAKVLFGVYQNFLNQPLKSRLKIWKNLLVFEKDENEIVKILSIEIGFMDVDIRIIQEMSQIIFIQKYFNANSAKIRKFNPALLTTLGQDLEQLISKSLTKYQISKKENNYKMLRLSIDAYLKLDVFVRQIEVATLLLELLVERDEQADLLAFSKEIIKNPQYAPLRNRAKLIILLDYEKKYLKDPDSNSKTFFNLLKIYLSDLKSDQWETVAQKNYDYLIKSKLFVEAESAMVNLYKALPTKSHFLQLITIKFENKKCEDILAILEGKDNLEKTILEYKRECYLNLAQNNKKTDGSFDSYKKSILGFINLSEGNKKNAAIADYLNSAKNNPSDKTKLEFQKLLDSEFILYRFTPEVFPIYQEEVLRLVEVGDFTKAMKYLQGCDKNEICKKMNVLNENLHSTSKIDNSSGNLDFSTISSENLKYVSLLSPESFIKAFTGNKIKASYNPILVLISARLSQLDWNNPELKNFYLSIEDQLSKSEKNYLYSKSWANFNKIKFPDSAGRNTLGDKEILALMQTVQKSREILLEDLTKYSFDNQMPILLKGKEIEIKMADTIKMSPIPNSLDESKVAEYEVGLKELAEEFVNQSKVYEKALENIIQQNLQAKNQEAEKYKDYVPPNGVSKWVWVGQDSYVKGLTDFIQKKHFTQAIFYLDYLLSVSKIDLKEYYTNRSGILLLSAVERKKAFPMVRYVWDECMINKQEAVLADWKRWSSKK